jgi:dTMP kinase
MASGIFITLEGVEGSGKTTHAARLADALESEGRAVTLTHEPGGTKAGQAIRALFLDPEVKLEVGAELLLVLADRAQHVREKLKPALARGEIVISDRYSDSTVAYQGYGRGYDLRLLNELNIMASDGLIPDLTIVLDCSAEAGLERTKRRARATHTPDRFEGEELAFHNRVREGFHALVRAHPARARLIDTSAPVATVTLQIRQAVDELIQRRCP